MKKIENTINFAGIFNQEFSSKCIVLVKQILVLKVAKTLKESRNE